VGVGVVRPLKIKNWIFVQLFEINLTGTENDKESSCPGHGVSRSALPTPLSTMSFHAVYDEHSCAAKIV
jgi:hypothetical protein